VDECQLILILKCELSQLLLVSQMFDISILLFAGLSCEISS